MLGEVISTEGPIHINCSVQLYPFDYHGKVQLGVTIEHCILTPTKQCLDQQKPVRTG